MHKKKLTASKRQDKEAEKYQWPVSAKNTTLQILNGTSGCTSSHHYWLTNEGEYRHTNYSLQEPSTIKQNYKTFSKKAK